MSFPPADAYAGMSHLHNPMYGYHPAPVGRPASTVPAGLAPGQPPVVPAPVPEAPAPQPEDDPVDNESPSDVDMVDDDEPGEKDVGPDGPNPTENDKDTGSNVQKQYRSLFSQLSCIFEDKFDRGGNNVDIPIAQAKLNLNNPSPFLKINPPLQRTWFDPTHKDSPSDSVSYFNSDTKFPSASNIFTKDFPVKPPSRPADITIVDPLLKKLLTAPKMEVVHLDPSTFQPATTNVKSSPQPAVDALIRSGLLDSLVARELLEMMHLLFPLIKEELTSLLGKEVESPSLSLLEDLTCFASFNNDRSTHTQMAALVNNKLSLRDQVLRRFSAPPSTAQILRGLNFAGDQLFGPLPESFSARLQMVMGQSLLCKTTGSSSSLNSRVTTAKRSSQASGYPAPKRQRPASTSPPTSQFFRGQPKRSFRGPKKSRGK